MTLNELADQIREARYVRGDDDEAMRILERFIASQRSKPKPRPTMPPFNFGSLNGC
jgi:hypothetical protein